MLANYKRTLLATSLSLLLSGLATSAMAGTAGGPAAVDLGTTDQNQTINVTLVLQLHNEAALEAYAYQTVQPGGLLYHKFLTTAQFARQYGATDSEIAQVQSFLQKNGIKTNQIYDNHLAISTTGTVAQFNAAFQTSIHDYTSNGKRFHQPSRAPVMPAALAGSLVIAAGLDNQAHYRPHHMNVNRTPGLTITPGAFPALSAATAVTASGTATGIPGEYTVGDVANFYNINPLYNQGIDGKGTTIGVVTLANFLPADAFKYWSMIGLNVKPNRITQVHVDGGGELSGDAGSGETSIDVEQSGGLAPQANIIVYDAPNTDAGFIDVFNRAISDNIADTISDSWGQPEIFYFNSLLSGGDFTSELKAFHQAFLEAAVQGISMFAASGDSGAFDTVRALGNVQFNAPLTVDEPAADPFMTAAGGTTRPFTFSFSGGPTNSITQESVWGWDYIENYFEKNFGEDLGLFSVGGGGGVSVFWPVPLYQLITPGIRTSEKGQKLIDLDPLDTLGINQTTPITLLTLPANFHGRNVPDESLDADPETGFVYVASTDSPNGIVTGEGGTSFVAPQLNGITALLIQSTHRGRIGFWNPQLYLLNALYGTRNGAPITDIKAGDNWFYNGVKGYEPGAGMGTVNVANFAQGLKLGL
jgi:kumamolisin